MYSLLETGNVSLETSCIRATNACCSGGVLWCWQEQEEREEEEREKEFQRQRQLQGSGLDLEGGVPTYSNQAFGLEVADETESTSSQKLPQVSQKESMEKYWLVALLS